MGKRGALQAVIALVAVLLLATSVWGQFSLGAKLVPPPEGIEEWPIYIDCDLGVGFFGLESGIAWQSIERIGQEDAVYSFYARGKLRTPLVIGLLRAYAGGGMGFTIVPFLDNTFTSYEFVLGGELSLSSVGVPFTAYGEMTWATATEQVEFGDGVFAFGFRIELFSFEVASDERALALREIVEEEPCCTDPEVLRRWRQND